MLFVCIKRHGGYKFARGWFWGLAKGLCLMLGGFLIILAGRLPLLLAESPQQAGIIPARLSLAEAEELLLQRNLSVLASRYQIEASRAARPTLIERVVITRQERHLVISSAILVLAVELADPACGTWHGEGIVSLGHTQASGDMLDNKPGLATGSVGVRAEEGGRRRLRLIQNVPVHQNLVGDAAPVAVGIASGRGAILAEQFQLAPIWKLASNNLAQASARLNVSSSRENDNAAWRIGSP